MEFAAAASCLKQSIHGDFNQVTREEVMALVSGGSGRLGGKRGIFLLSRANGSWFKGLMSLL